MKLKNIGIIPQDNSIHNVEFILNTRRKRIGNRKSKTEYLVKFIDIDEPMWIPYTHLSNDVISDFRKVLRH